MPEAATKPFSVPYEVKSAAQLGSSAALTGGAAGLLYSAVLNAVQTHNSGFFGVFTRTGGSIGFFAAMTGSCAFVSATTANIRQKDDAINGFSGGCAAGFLAGAKMRSFPVAFASCAFLGTMIGTLEYNGGSLLPKTQSKGSSEFSGVSVAEKRKSFFKPVTESPPWAKTSPES